MIESVQERYRYVTFAMKLHGKVSDVFPIRYARLISWELLLHFVALSSKRLSHCSLKADEKSVAEWENNYLTFLGGTKTMICCIICPDACLSINMHCGERKKQKKEDFSFPICC